MQNIVTRQKMIDMCAREHEYVQHVVGRALVVLHNLQTESEKQILDAHVDNLEGFTKGDARTGQICARYYMKHRSLQDWQVANWIKQNVNGIPRIAKYWNQLNIAANRKIST